MEKMGKWACLVHQERKGIKDFQVPLDQLEMRDHTEQQGHQEPLVQEGLQEWMVIRVNWALKVKEAEQV